MCLGVDRSLLSSLRSKYKTEQKRLHEVLSNYMSNAAKPPTWATFIDCLRTSRVGQDKLATKIEKKKCEGTGKD